MKIYYQWKNIEVVLQNFAILWLINPLLNKLFPYYVLHMPRKLHILRETNLSPHSYASSLFYFNYHNQ